MKKILAAAICIWILTGCTPMLPSPHGNIADGGTVRMYTQFPVYDRDIDRIQVILENGGDIALEYGTEWAVEKRQGDAWVQVPFIPNAGWTQPLLMLSPGGTYSYYVYTDMLDVSMKDGQYRVVKEVSDTVYAAEFSIGESDVSADSPFGYVPLEELPMDYSAEDAVRDGVVVYHSENGTYENEEKIAAFLHDVVRGVQTQIRFAFYSSDSPDKVLIDEVLYTEGIGSIPRFQIRRDWSRQQPEASITSQYFTHLTTRNDKLFRFANSPDTYVRGDTSAVDLPALNKDWAGKEDWLNTITEYAVSRYGSVSAWSPDGLRHIQASMDEVLTFYVNVSYPEGGSMGYTADLLSEEYPVKIQEFVWEDETTVMIVCATAEEGLEYFASFDTDTQKITHWSTGKNGFTWENGKIVIVD